MPKNKPSIIKVPKMNCIVVREKWNLNEENWDYQNTIALLFGIFYTLKMSYDYKIYGFFEYVVLPLEKFWWQEWIKGVDYCKKDKFKFISIIRLPDFVTKNDFKWAIKEAIIKTKLDFSRVEFLSYNEGLCVQCMHNESYNYQLKTVDIMHKYIKEKGYKLDIWDTRYHLEIYLSDPRKCNSSKLKTVVSHPIK